MVKPIVARGVLNADLEKIRGELEKYPLIREAQVARLLPDRLRVTIVERQPVALALKGSVNSGERSVVCVDGEGGMFGDSSYWRGRARAVGGWGGGGMGGKDRVGGGKAGPAAEQRTGRRRRREKKKKPPLDNDV